MCISLDLFKHDHKHLIILLQITNLRLKAEIFVFMKSYNKMASLDEAFNMRLIPKALTVTGDPLNAHMGYICRICGGCYNYHKTKHVQSKNSHQFIKGIYRELLPFEQYAFDDATGYSYVN
jgi:hypothetical protein